MKNPFFIGDHPGLTQTLGWVDAWTTAPSIYALAARDAEDVAAGINFARQYGLPVAIRGGGHSYQGTSNAPNSLLIWTRGMNDVTVNEETVTLGAGAMWGHAYDAVTTRNGKYVQGGGCTTVGVAGLIQSGGFGSFSKRYGTAAGSLLEAQVVTADGQIRVANEHEHADLFWALKGGGGGTFGVVTKVTLRLHQLPDLFGAAFVRINAASADAYRELIERFVSFYQRDLFNERWGEHATFGPGNMLDISMLCQGLGEAELQTIWAPFLEPIRHAPHLFTFEHEPFLCVAPARKWWDPAFINSQVPGTFLRDPRPGAAANDVWWSSDTEQVGQFLYAYESLWLDETLLTGENQRRLVQALFDASRHADVSLHFNKGLAGAPAEAIARARDTATNPAMLSAFALAISADSQGPAYPGITGHEPDVTAGRKSRRQIRKCMDALRELTPNGGSYVSESDYFQTDWHQAYWGEHYARLVEVKRKYDPGNVFSVHHGVTA